MARFDVYRLANGDYVLDCQADLLNELTTRFMVPLVPSERVSQPMKRLNPRFTVEGEALVMMTQFSGAVPLRSLGKPVMSLQSEQDAIGRALDMLIVGF